MTKSDMGPAMLVMDVPRVRLDIGGRWVRDESGRMTSRTVIPKLAAAGAGDTLRPLAV